MHQEKCSGDVHFSVYVNNGMERYAKNEWQTFQERSFLSLSGGEKQRVLIASAFARKSKLIILDEPTNHLDIGYQFLILDIMKKHKGTTIFTSVHDMNMALRYYDYVIALEKGQIAATGKPHKVITEKLMNDLFKVKTKIQINEDGSRYIQYLGGILQA